MGWLDSKGVERGGGPVPINVLCVREILYVSKYAQQVTMVNTLKFH